MIRVAVLAAVLAFADSAAADPKYAWNLAELYPSETAWVAAKDAAVADIPKITGCRGKLGSSAGMMFDSLETYFDIDRRLALSVEKSAEALGEIRRARIETDGHGCNS